MDKTLQKYVDENYDKLDKYINDVQKGFVVAGELEKLFVQRFIDFKNIYIYKEEEVKRVIKFFYLLNIPVKNTFKRFPLLPFQVFFVACAYGLYINEEERLFKRALLSMSKKNGKTMFNAGLALFELIYDKELSASIVLLASSKEQANYALKYIKEIIDNSPLLPKLKNQRNSIFYKTNTINEIQIRSADSDKLQGANISFSLIDEFGAHKDSLLADRAFSSFSGRYNPLQVIISTAYHNKDKSPLYELEQTGINILRGVSKDDSFLVMLYKQDDVEKEIHKPETWRKSNPALGYTVNPSILDASYNQACLLPSKMVNFRTDNLNMWVDNLKSFIADEIIKKQMKDNKQIPLNSDVYVGTDLSATRDLSSIYVLYYNEDTDKFVGDVYFLFPQNPDNMIRKGSVNLMPWINDKFIIHTPEKAILDEDVFNVIEKINDKYNIISFGIDPFLVEKLKVRLENELSIEVNKVKQDIRTLSTPTKEVEKAIITGKMYLPKTPVLRWNFRNVLIYTDANNNIKIQKNKSESVDGVVALSVAMHEFLAYNYGYNQNQAYDDYINSVYMKATTDK